MRLALYSAAAAILAGSALANPVGLQIVEIEMPHHGQPSMGAIWYPGDGSGDAQVFAQNPVFQGVEVLAEGGMAPGPHPVVLFSHGMGGGVESVAWLASGLAARGAIVVAVNHRNSTWRAFDMAEGVKHWTRAQDMQVALDYAEAAFGDAIDPARVMAAGFSYGGWTALSLGGARGNHAGILEVCAAQGAEMVYCDEFLSPEINLAGVDAAAWNASYADARVTQVAAIDPGFVWGLEAADVAELGAEVSLIGLGALEDRLKASDFDSSGFAALVPEASAEWIIPAVHFSAMPLCTPAGVDILEEEQDDPVCSDPEGADRAAVHARIIDSLVGQLGL